MAVIGEVIRLEADNTLSFGNYDEVKKQKADNFEVDGDLYKVKTHKEITRLEKNGKLLFESVPGAAVHRLKMDEKALVFEIEGFEDTQITVELEPEQDYKILIDHVNVGSMRSSFSGKVSFSMGLHQAVQSVKIEKI